jgi:type I restriction enzyme S subunit
LFQFLRSSQYWRWIQRSTRAGAQPNINAKEYGELRIPLPPAAEQQRISRVLHNLGQQLPALRKVRDLVTLEKTALMQQLLTGKRRMKVNDATAPVAVNG